MSVGTTTIRRRLAAVVASTLLSSGIATASILPSVSPVEAASPPAPGTAPAGHSFLSDGSTTVSGPRATISAPLTAPGFADNVVFSGLPTGAIDGPTKVRFGPDGKIWVLIKDGRIEYFNNLSDNTPTLFADLRDRVHSYWDRGLMGLAISPNYASDHSIYVLYSYDHNPVSDIPGNPFGAPAIWENPSTGTHDYCPSNPGGTSDGCTILGRLSRLTATSNGLAWTGAETPLVTDWCQQFPSHSQDDLWFGADGFLYASSGEGSNFNQLDYGQWGGKKNPIVTPANPCGDPPNAAGTADSPPDAEGGALRAQSERRQGNGPVSLGGTVIRVDPATGNGVSGNPYFSSSDPNRRRIIAFGLRNPFRFTFRPGASELWIGDVGWSTWEEIDRLSLPAADGSNNFGWPCNEGPGPQSTYQGAGLGRCASLSNAVGPYYTYNHSSRIGGSEVNCTVGSSSISGMTFYSSTSYPSQYHNALFFTDHSRNCVWAMLPGGNGLPNPSNIVTVVDGGAGAVDLLASPDGGPAGTNGDIFYVDYDNGTIHRIQYGAPQVSITSNVTTGAAPLVVHFDGSGSSTGAPPLTYAWDLDGNGTFGDRDDLGATNTATPRKTYGVPGTYNVRLRVTDNNGVSTTSSPYPITAGDTPPNPIIDLIDGSPPPPQPGNPPPAIRPNGVPAFWAVGDTISFAGHATDQQQGTIPTSGLSWAVILHHCPSNCHTHSVESFAGVASGSFGAPDHDYPSFLEVRLTATDAQGLQASASIYLYPKTSVFALQSSPSGLTLNAGTGGGTTPLQLTFVQGSSVALTAPLVQTANGFTYGFASWSDGGAATHTVTAPTVNVTFTATYARIARIFGPDRYGTSAAAANLYPPNPPLAYVATGETYPDALAAAALAGGQGVPILLVRHDAIPASIGAVLTRLHPGRIVVVGGTGAVSDAVKAQLGAYTAGAVTRIGGADRYATAALLAASVFPGGASKLYIVTGENFPDALGAAPLAAKSGAPVLLVTHSTIPSTIAAEIKKLNPTDIVIVGGIGAVSKAVADQLISTYLAGNATHLTRIAGVDRYDTAAKVAVLIAPNPNPKVAYIATGLDFPDALSAAGLAGLNGAPLLLVQTNTPLPASTASALNTMRPKTMAVVGGPGVVSNAVLSALAGYLGP